MHLRTIWFLPGMSTKVRLLRTRDWTAMKIAGKLPARLKYWVTILELGHATAKSPNIPATPLDEVLSNLRTPKNLI